MIRGLAQIDEEDSRHTHKSGWWGNAMIRGLWVFIAFVLAAHIPAGRAAEEDSVRVALDKAKAVYDADLAKYRIAVSAWFDKREEVARFKGDKKAVDQVRSERQTFADKGDLPKSIPVAVKSRSATARSALESAYKVAVREYTKARRDDEATAVEKELEAFQKGTSVRAGFVKLFNGKDLASWQMHPKDESRWSVEDGVLVGRGPTGYLFTDRGNYKDFILRAEVLVGEGDNGGVFFRCPNGGGKPGYEVDINSPSRGPSETGTILVYQKDGKAYPAIEVKKPGHKAGEWFTLELIVRSNRFTVKVNDITVSELTDRGRNFSEGHIALQHYVSGKEIKFRKIEISEYDGK